MHPFRFRFRTTFQAPTAMTRTQDEVPESYLNKGKIYDLKVRDSMPPMTDAESIRYRTFIRISFDQEDHRADPSAYWRLWEENRGLPGSYNREKNPPAVEYIGQEHTPIRIEQVTLDGLCVNWTGHPDTDEHGCRIPVRFNFLSTDFSRAKGVKGISVRLCAKTEQISPAEMTGVPELCYCKVKLFRDHGAERKLSNDAASVRKKVDRLMQQFQEPPVFEPVTKRRRSRVDSKRTFSRRASKQALKCQDAWPPGLDEPSPADFQHHLESKMSALQRTLESTFSESYLCLRGDIRDDPDLYPISESDIRHPTTSITSYRSSYSPDFVSFGNPSPGQITSDLPERARRRLSTASSKHDDRDPHNVAGTVDVLAFCHDSILTHSCSCLFLHVACQQ